MLHDYINNCLSSEKYHIKKNKGISGWTRVSNIKFVLDITLDILMAFLDIDCNKTISVFSYDNRFIESINKCVEYTLDLLKEQKKDKDEVIITKLLKDIWDPESEIVTTDKEHFLCGIKNNPDSLPEQFVIYQNKKHRFCLRAKDAARYLGHKTTNCTIRKKLDNLGLIRAGKDRTKAVFKGETNAKFLCINEKSLANYLGVENEYLPPDIKDKTYKGCLGHSIMTNSGNYSAQTMPEQDETDYSDIETQMCDNSDDMSDNPILSFINECAAKKHHKKF